MSQIIGHISQVIGPVVDVYFEGTESDLILPSIHDALEIKRHNGKKLIVEVQQHIGENTVRTVAMDSTDGLQRGMKVFPTGGPITMPVGEQIKGRLMNVVGDSIDGMKELNRDGAYSIQKEVRSVCLAGPEWVKLYLLWSSLITLPRSIMVFPYLPEWESVPVKVMICFVR